MKGFIRIVAGLCAAISFTQANATIVTFTGTGVFSNVANCFGLPGCSITNGGHQLNMSGFDPTRGFQPSTMVANTISGNISVPPSYTDYIIGELTWVNRATFLTDPDFDVKYTFDLNFSSPSVTSDSQAFNLEIKQTPNPQGDLTLNLANSTLSGLDAITLAGVTVSDIHFALSGAGTYNGVSGLWTNPEGSTSHLYILADFNAAAPVTPAVPEPTTWAMVIMGFAGVGFIAHRRRNRVQALSA